MSKALESKHDKILKNLLRQPDNKRCINCETLGPQYAVADLQIFVCTVCSGVHRQFSHRVKGLSTSTFKPEEIKGLESGGNRVAAYTYLAKWSPSDLQKPVDRNTGKIKDWIDAVYIKKRFYSAEAAASAMHSPPPSSLPRRSISSNASSAGDDVPVMSMAGLLGDVKLKVDPNHLVSNAPNGLDVRATSTASSHSHDSPAPNHVSNQLFNILDEPLAETAAGAPLQATPPSSGWDAFAAPAPAPAPAPATNSMAWSAFDDGGPAPAAPVLTNHHQLPPQTQQRPQQQVQQPQQQQQQQPQQAEAAWAAFDGGFSQPSQQQPQQQFQASQQQQPQQQAQQQQGGPAAQPTAAPQPPKPAPRQELPLDLFGDGLLSSYNVPPSIGNMYGQPPVRPGLPYGQQAVGYQQPPLHPQMGGYQQGSPARPPGLPHGMSFGVYGQQGNPGATSSLNAFDGAARPRTQSETTGAGAMSGPDPFGGLVPGLGGALPSMPPSRQTSVSSTHSAQDLPGHAHWSANPAVSQSFGVQHAAQQPSQQANMSFSDPFAGSNYATQPAVQNAAPGGRGPPKSSGNPFA